MAARVGIEGRDAHQPMHAVLGLEPAEGVAPFDLNRCRLDARGFAFGLFQPLDLVAVPLGPARIHAKQHASPILALGAARPGVHFEIGIVGVGLAREQRLELAPRHLGLELLQRRFRLGNGFLIFLGLAELDHGQLVVELLFDAGDGSELVFERGALLHHALCALLVIPEVGILCLAVEFG